MSEVLLQNKSTLKKVGNDYFLHKDGQGVACPFKAPIQQFNKMANAMETFIQPCNYLCAVSALQQVEDKLYFHQRCGAGHRHEIQSVISEDKPETPLLKI